MAKTKAPNLDLKRERFRQQMNRTALATHTGLSRKALIDIELRRTQPRFDSAARIAKALKCDIADVFDPSEVIG